jgi:hypothetical protein
MLEMSTREPWGPLAATALDDPVADGLLLAPTARVEHAPAAATNTPSLA